MNIDNDNSIKEESINDEPLQIPERSISQISSNSNISFLNKVYNHYSFIFAIIITFLLSSFIALLTITIMYTNFDYKFILSQLSRYMIISIIQYCCALLVIHKNVKVNYTRKIIHISYFIFPQLIDILLEYDKTFYTESWNVWIILLLLAMLSEIIRNKISFIGTMFKAVDRPEDRPHTLFWFSTQIIAGLCVIIPFSIYFSSINKIGLIFIPILINGLGDGLAEPVGVYLGKHKYTTKACCSHREYTRSFEGSACVFIVSTIIILCYYNYITLHQYLFCIFTIPISVTFTEAYAPHTWDCPFIYLVSCLYLVFANELL